MKIRLAKKIMKIGDFPPKDMKKAMRNSYWFKRWDEAMNNYGCVYFCEDWYKCRFRNRFDHRITKAISLTSKHKYNGRNN